MSDDNDLAPLTVLVTEGRWDVFDLVTPRNEWLFAVLKEMGGIADTVSPGTYHFNLREIDGQIIASLDPA